MRTILLVEGHAPGRDALGRRLERRGFHVVPAMDGAQAVALARQSRPDVILMGPDLPAIESWDAARQLKRDTATLHIPIIVLSAQAMTTDLDSKPIRFERLLDKIESCLLKGAIAR